MLILALLASLASSPSVPDPTATPGALCTERDPDFWHHAYPERVPICKRHVTPSLRKTAFALYGIPRSRWSEFELDHWVPLALGGSNSVRNLFPQEKAKALKKDVLETRLYRALRAGKISQGAAVEAIRTWRP